MTVNSVTILQMVMGAIVISDSTMTIYRSQFMSNEATLYSRATLKKLGVDWRVRLAKEVFLVKFI